MDLTYREDYWDDLELKREFIGFIKGMHNLDLSLWDELGYWDRRYRPFSYFADTRLVSNVCIYSMDMTVEGRRCTVAQVSGVGTLAGFRRKGLSSELTRKAMEWALPAHDFFFLFADPGAFPFYKSCGFHRLPESVPRIEVTGRRARPGAVKLDLERENHLVRIRSLVQERAAVSGILGNRNDRLFMLWCHYALRDCVHLIDDLDILVLFKRDGGLLTIHDIVGRQVPPFSEIYPYIGSEKDEKIEFLFMTDRLELTGPVESRVEEKNGTHYFGDFPLKGKEFIFPFTGHA